MPILSISNAASEKILQDRDARSRFLGRPVIPPLHYYHRCHSPSNDGRTIECGAGLTLSFVESGEAGDDQYLSIGPGNDCTLLIGPATLVPRRSAFHRLADQKFKLNSPVC